jgi:hypothetical protein
MRKLFVLVFSAFWLVPILVSSAEAVPGVASEIYALLIIDTQTSARAVEGDELVLKAMIDKVGAKTELLIGADVRTEKVREYLNRLPDMRGKTLFVYFAGPTQLDPATGDQNLVFSGVPAWRDYLLRNMNRKHPQLSVLVVESAVAALVSKKEMVLTPLSGNAERYLDFLFRRHEGTVEFTSSAFNEKSWRVSGQGGIFTQAFVDIIGRADLTAVIESNDAKFLGWPAVAEGVAARTKQLYSESDSDRVLTPETTPTIIFSDYSRRSDLEDPRGPLVINPEVAVSDKVEDPAPSDLAAPPSNASPFTSISNTRTTESTPTVGVGLPWIAAEQWFDPQAAYVPWFGAALSAQPHEGFTVGNLYPRWPAWRAGLAPGDTITEVNGQPVSEFRRLTVINNGVMQQSVLIRATDGNDGREWFFRTAIPPSQR